VGDKKRVALKPHTEQIREWVNAGKTDEWIADALGTSPSSVQSFRSRNDIHRRGRGAREPGSVFEGVLDHGEREGWGLWLDPSIAEDPIWKEHWASVDSVVVKLSEDSIVLEPGPSGGAADAGSAAASAEWGRYRQAGGPAAAEPAPVEKGRVKWFDPDKGYGFLSQPSGEDLFVHRSEVKGDPSSLSPGGEVEFEVGRNDRGPVARGVRAL
jgi:cold shock CspA family protein